MSTDRFTDADSIESLIAQAIGAGSMCWEHVNNAGVFQSTEARVIADDAAARAHELLATVRPDPDTVHFECDCVPDLGPSHCHACSKIAGTETPWSETYHGPLDARQVETVGYAMRQHHVVYDALHMVAGCACGYDGPMLADHAACAVLTALAEVVGRG